MSDFKKWFEETQHVKYPGVPWESTYFVMMRLADAMAEYVDKEVERLREEKEKQQ